MNDLTEEVKKRIWDSKAWFFDLEGHSEIPDKWERLCVLLKEQGQSYGNIQKHMANVSKKWIRKTLLKWAPELIEN